MNREIDRQPEFTARDAAKALVRPYALRGDEIEWLKSGQLGHYGREYCAQIGGWMVSWYKLENEKRTKLRPDQIGVSRVRDVEVHQIFPLPEIFNEVKREAQSGAMIQRRLF